MEYWLDVGAGIDAEHWSATPGVPGVARVAMDPLLTSGMISTGRLARLPVDILRVGGELRPEHSTETAKQPSFLPFRDAAFTRVHCGFLLHLYLEILPLLADETHRVLTPGGELTVLLPHFGDAASSANLRVTQETLERGFGNAALQPFEGPFTTFWADLYRTHTLLIRCVR